MNTTLPEVEGYIELLRELRAGFLEAALGFPPAALNWRPPIPETNSIYVLATHVLGAETWWIHEIVGGQATGRHRAAEFVAEGGDLDWLPERMRQVAERSEAVLAGLTDADLRDTRQREDEPVTVQWCILHVIDHYSRHLGHLELTRQLWETRSGEGGAALGQTA